MTSAPLSFNDETHTLRAVVATDGFSYRRFSWELGDHIVALNFREGLDISRVQDKAAPLRWMHEEHAGIIEEMSLNGSDLEAGILFTREELGASLFRKYKEGTLTKFSLGFLPSTLTLLSRDEESGICTYEATGIKVYEVSAVDMPENQKTHLLSAENDQSNLIHFPLTIIGNQAMGANAPGSTTSAPETVQQLSAETVNQIRLEEQDRMFFLSSMQNKHSLQQEFIEKLAKDNVPKSQCSELILEKLSASQTEPPKTTRIEVTADGTEREIQSAVDALVCHHLSQPLKLTKLSQDNKFRGMSMRSVLGYFLEQHGTRIPYGRSDIDLFKNFQSMKEFPVIQENFASRVLLEGYQSPEKSFLPFVRIKEVSSFTDNLKARPGRAPALVPVGEDGTVADGKLSPDETVRYAIRAYSRKMGITRSTIMSDDLGHFTETVFAYGTQAAMLEADLVYSQIINNPLMGDNLPLFDKAHNNIGNGQKIGDEGLSEARRSIRMQRDQDDNRLNLTPAVLIVGAQLETIAEKWTYTDLVPTRPDDVNTFQRSIKRVVDSIMDDNPDLWFLATDTKNPIVEIAYLKGQREPYILSDANDINVDGTTFRYGLDVGARAIDWRGIWCNQLPKSLIYDPSKVVTAAAAPRRAKVVASNKPRRDEAPAEV